LGKDARGVPTLISLLADSSSAIRGQAEELLFGIAGDHAPRLCLADGTVAACRRYSEQWKTWWQTNGDVIDWNHLVLEQSWLTEPLVVEMDSNKVWALGPNAHPRWEIRGLHGPMDAQLLPNGRVLVAEYQGRRVTERDRSGNIYWSKEIDGSPVACRRLPNGNTFVATHTTLTEFGPDGRTLYLRYPGEGLFLFYAQRLTNGRIVFIANPGIIREIDTASGNELKTIRLGSEFGGWCGVETLNGGHYLVAFLNSGKVLEVDAAGKTVWECLIPGACHATRLADGSTVVANTTGMRLVTVDRSGRLRQEIRTEGRPWRVHARP
jgi:hypothetical protein